MSKIRTVKGDIDTSVITGIYPHEHLAIDQEWIRKTNDAVIDNPNMVANELEAIKKHQINLVVDLTNIVMGRDVEQLKKISDLTNMHIVAATGLYLESYCKDYEHFSVEKLSQFFIDEINNGIGENKIKPGIIGEIPAGPNGISKMEHKTILASAIAQKASNLPIYTHSHLGNWGFDVATLLIAKGVSPHKIAIGHLDLNNNLEELIKILNLGVYIGFDTIGKDEYNSNENRISNLVTLVKKGYRKQILISQDLTKKSHYKVNNGYGFDYIFEHFLPSVIDQLGQDIAKDLLLSNPLSFLSL